MQADEHWYKKVTEPDDMRQPHTFFKSKDAVIRWMKTQNTEGVSEPFESAVGDLWFFVNKGNVRTMIFERVKVVVNE